MKVKFLLICSYINIIAAVFNVLIAILLISGSTDLTNLIFNNKALFQCISFMNIIVMIVWFYSLYIWSKKDNKTKSLILLVLLMSIYSPIYIIKAHKKGWLENVHNKKD